VATDIRLITEKTYQTLWQTGKIQWLADKKKITIQSNQGGTLFGLFRSLYWDNTKKRLEEIQTKPGPESIRVKNIINAFLSDYRRMDFIISLSLLPIHNQNLLKEFVNHQYPDFSAIEQEFNPALMRKFGWLLANY